MTTITPDQLQDRLRQEEKLHLLDVRSPEEHAEIHVAGVHLPPLDRLDATKLASGSGFAWFVLAVAGFVIAKNWQALGFIQSSN